MVVQLEVKLKEGWSKMPGKMPMVGGKPAFAVDGKGKMRKGGVAKMTKSEMPSKMSKVKTSPTRDGVAIKGKTKGKMVKMMKSGGAC
jgi:hypothetical protein